MWRKTLNFVRKPEIYKASSLLREAYVPSRNSIPTAKIIKVAALLCIIYWIIALFVTWKSPATQFESSIYSATPLMFWIANTLNLLVGIGIIVHQITYQNDKRESDLWIIGFVLVFLAFSAILSLWIIRGYALLGEGDAITHLGMIKNIISTGQIKSSNYYPITHIYFAQLSQLSNISPNILTNCIPIAMAIFSILFMYCLAQTVLHNKWQVLLAVIIWIAFLSSSFVVISPNTLANLYFPLAIFILIKCFYSKQIQWKILFIIMIFFFPMFHPLVGFILMGFIMIMWLYERLINHEQSMVGENNSRFIFTAAAISLIWGIVWNASFTPWKQLMTSFMANLTAGGASNLTELAGQISYAVGYHYSVIGMLFKTYAAQIIIVVLTAYCLIVLWRRGFFKQKLRRLALLFSALPMLVIAIAFLYIENTGFSPNRLIIFFILLCTLFVGYILYQIIKKSKDHDYHHMKSKIKFSSFSFFSISIIILLFIIGGLQLYPSRYTLQPNLQTTRTEYDGMNWFLQNKDISVNQTSITVNAYRWASLFLTPAEQVAEGYSYPGAETPTNLVIPWHFGYDTRQNLGQFYNNNIYMVLNTRDTLLYQEIWPEMAAIRFQNKDFNQIERDTSIDSLYSNGGLNVYYVNSIPSVQFEANPFNWAR